MPDLLPGISQAATPADKAALIAELAFQDWPRHVALVARRCIILHWFDRSILAALLPEDSPDGAAAVYDWIASLPFIESVPWGLAYHELTRQGLLNRYASTQPDMLVTAARLAAPAYAAKEADQNAAEAFFCHIVAGQPQAAADLLDHMLDTLSAQGEWASLAYYFKVQDEAEALPFVTPLARTSSHWMGRFLAHYYARDPAAAIADLDRLIELDRDNAAAYTNRGVTYAALQDYPSALADYARAIELDPNDASPVYNTACAFARQNKVGEACDWLRRAIQMSGKYIENARADSDFDSIRDAPEFQALLKEYE